MKIFIYMKEDYPITFTNLRTEKTRAILPMALILFLMTSLRRLAAAPINTRDTSYGIRMMMKY